MYLKSEIPGFIEFLEINRSFKPRIHTSVRLI